ncbi:hypothetical protein [Adlercreutzia sp. ZJ242]|uniref:hypothetical protein n=1 Tax=Adlercreutzia sp. ZJ242 TaxID=2709409 RepID=UPI0013EBF742|nr:hypothetical protein [Adlercreutzia sp. ZJ242]
MQYNVYLTIGHNVKGTPTHTTKSVCDNVSAFLGIEAYTAIPCFGMWRGEAESSTRVEVCALDRAQAEGIRERIPALAQALAQDSIMCEVREARTAFIEAAAIQAAKTA